MRLLFLLLVWSIAQLGCGDDGMSRDTGIGFDATPRDSRVEDVSTDGSGDASADGAADSAPVDAGMLSPDCYAPATETVLGSRVPTDPVGLDVSADASGYDVGYIDAESLLALRRFGADGAAAGGETTPLSSTAFYQKPSLARTTTDLAIAYVTNEPGRFEARVATRSLSGTTLRTPTRLTTVGEIAGRAQVAGLEGVGFAVAYTVRDSGGTTHLRYLRIDAAGAALEDPTDLAMNIPLDGFDLARDGEGTAVSWMAPGAGGVTLRLRPTDVDGVLLAEDIDVVADRRIPGRPAAARVGAEGTLVAWAQTVGGARTEIHTMLVRDDGVHFVERIATGAEQGSQPDLAAMPLAVGLAYRGTTTEGASLRFRLLTFDGEGLIDPMTIGAIEGMGGDVAIGATLDARSFGVAFSDIVGTSLESRFVAVHCGG